MRTLRGRLLLWHAVAVLGVLLALALVLDRVLESFLIDQLTDALVTDGRAVQQALPPQGDPQSEVVRLGTAMDVRITVIGTDGVVLADSEHDPATMENHRTRPEVREALRGRIGVSSRPSATIGIPFRYVALPPYQERIVRVALPLTTVHSRLVSVRWILVAGFGLAALAGLLVLAALGRSIGRPLARMTESVQRLGEGDFAVEVPEAGTDELILLATTLNRMRREVASRIEAMERDRKARDAILSSLAEGVILFDGDGEVLYQNDSAVRLIGGALENVRGLTPSTLQRMVGRASAEAMSQGETVAGAGTRTLLATAVPVSSDGNVLLVLRDVTQARRLDAVRRDFVANASHELKTPVASIRALAETIGSAAAADPEAVRRFTAGLEREAERLSRVISDLLDLSRLEGEPGQRSRVRFDRLVLEEAERLRDRAGDAGLEVQVRADHPLTVNGSERDLRLLVRNLVENAVQYTRPGGRIEVTVAADDGQADLMVRDTGIGIPSKDQSRVFERFYRVDRARSRETGGTGLGLSIVKHVAETHGGSVDLRSQLGVGSTFIVRLPLDGR